MVADLLKHWKGRLSDGSWVHLKMWDTGGRDWRGQTIISYQLRHKGKIVFLGSDFAGSPMNCDDSRETVGSLLLFLSLRPGETDKEFFENYTADQLVWVREHGEWLSLLAHQMLGEL